MNVISRKIHSIQESDEATKRRWLVGASALTMGVVVIIWIFSFNFLAFENQPAPQSSFFSDDSFFSVMKNGVAIIGQKGIQVLSGAVFYERTMTVEQ